MFYYTSISMSNVRGLTIQVRAIVKKIREYYSIKDRNTLDDVDEVAVVQIGRFLQYMK